MYVLVCSEIDKNDLMQKDKVIWEKMFQFVFLFRQIKSLQNICFFKKILIPDTFKHVPWQNTFNMHEVYQISPARFDYDEFLVKCLNYQIIMHLCNVYALGP